MIHLKSWNTAGTSRVAAAAMAMALSASMGCAAAFPMRGEPASDFGWEERAPHRTGRDTIDLALLGQQTPPEHVVDCGDVLGIYVDGILGSCQCEQAIPIYQPQDRELPPSVGFPITVRTDGTISLPMAPPLNVRGKTLLQVEDLVRRTYTIDKPLLQTGRERILVSLQKPRVFRVLVIRQEAAQGLGNIGASDDLQENLAKRGTGRVVLLPAYRNDVLNALTMTGGLPGLDARNTIYVIRRGAGPGCGTVMPGLPVTPVPEATQSAKNKRPKSSIQLTSATSAGGYANDAAEDWGHSDVETTPVSPPRTAGASAPQGAVPGYTPDTWTAASWNAAGWNGSAPWQQAMGYGDPTIRNPRVTKIPMKLGQNEPACFGPDDILLNDGDIVFIESREPDYFYTGGLFGQGQYELPRDYDVDILDAISLAEGRRARMTFQYPPNKAIGGVSVLNQDITVGASKVVVQRKLENGCIANIEVDLHKALRDPAERIMVRPGDRIILRYTCTEAVGAWFERHIIDGFVAGASSGIFFGNN